MTFSTDDSFTIIAPRFTGCLSVISSFLILFIIVRSKHKLSTIYHRIMFGMSFADVLKSAAMGLTTLPMPEDMDVVADADAGHHHTHDLEGMRLGNMQTCTAQGFLLTFGMFAFLFYNVTLICYYACKIILKMEDKNFVKYIEPCLHLLSFGLGFGIAFIAVLFGMYNPDTHATWCSSIVIEEGHDSNVHSDTFKKFTSVLIISSILIYLIMIIMIIQTAARKSSPYNSRAGFLRTTTRLYRVREPDLNAKDVLIQALAYSIAFIVPLSPGLIRIFITDNLWVFRLEMILLPSQGFFNTLIFISHKVHDYKRLHQDVSVCYVLRLLFSGYREPVLLSRLSLVDDDNNFIERMRIEARNEQDQETSSNSSLCFTKEACLDDNDMSDNLIDLLIEKWTSLENPSTDQSNNDEHVSSDEESNQLGDMLPPMQEELLSSSRCETLNIVFERGSSDSSLSGLSRLTNETSRGNTPKSNPQDHMWEWSSHPDVSRVFSSPGHLY